MHKIFGQVSWKSCYYGQIIGTSRTCSWRLAFVIDIGECVNSFKKCKIFPLNPGEISDRPPPKFFVLKVSIRHPSTSVSLLHKGKRTFPKCYENNYNIQDPEYIAWLKIHHPDVDQQKPRHCHQWNKVLLIRLKFFWYTCITGSQGINKQKESQLVPNAKCQANDSVLEEIYLRSKVKEKVVREEEKRA